MLTKYLSIIIAFSLLFISCSRFPHLIYLTKEDEESKLIEQSKLNLSKTEAIDFANKYFDGTNFTVGVVGISSAFTTLMTPSPGLNFPRGIAPNVFPTDTPAVIHFKEDNFSFGAWGVGKEMGRAEPENLSMRYKYELVYYEKVYFNVNCKYSDSLTVSIFPGTYADIQSINIAWLDKKSATDFNVGVRVADTTAFYKLGAALKVLMPNAMFKVFKEKK